MTATIYPFPRERIVREQDLSKRELAMAIGRSPRWVQAAANERGCPHQRLPNGRLAFTLSDVLPWLDAQRDGAA